MSTEPKIAGVAVRAAGAQILAERAQAEGAQDELFGLPVADASGAIRAAVDRGARGPGRPKGASSRATVAAREYLLRRGVLPQALAMQWAMLGPDGIAVWLAGGAPELVTAELRVEALKLAQKLWADLGRYFMSPMVPTDDTGKPLPSFVVQFQNNLAPQGDDGAALPPWLADPARLQALSVVQSSEDDGESKEEGSK